MLEKLQKKLYTEIPLTQYMQLQLESIDDASLVTSAPLIPNINDKGTAFAGSLGTLVTISAWCACYYEMEKLGYTQSRIAVVQSNISYTHAVTQNLQCITQRPTQEEMDIVVQKLKVKKSASLKLTSYVLQDSTQCVTFEGIYVIKV